MLEGEKNWLLVDGELGPDDINGCVDSCSAGDG